MSVRTATRSPSLIRPIATPATGACIGTAASIIESDPPQTEAIDEASAIELMLETPSIIKRPVLEARGKLTPEDMVAWAKAKDAESEESDAIDALFAEQMECEENRLYKSKRQ